MLRIVAITLVTALVAGCTPSTPPDCRLALTGGQSSVPIDGWCVRSKGQPALAARDGRVLVGGSSMTRIDTATGAQTVLAGGDGQPVGAFADGGDEIFFSQCASTTACGILAVPWAGGAPRTVASTSTGSSGPARALAVDAQTVYWIDASEVWSAPRGGGTVNRLAWVSSTAGELAAGATALYIADIDQGTVERLPLDGALPAAASGRDSPTSLRTSGDTAYWIEGSIPTSDLVAGNGSVHAWSATGTPVTLASGLIGLSQLAAARDSLVWTATMSYADVTVPDGSVVGLLHGATTPTTVAGEQLFPGTIVIDGSRAYWTVSSNYDGHAAIAHATIP